MTQATGAAADRRIVGAERSLGGVYQRFGKADLVASLLGMLTALGALTLLTTLLVAFAAALGVSPNMGSREIDPVGAVVALAALFASFLLGGIAAGRMSRYDGGVNGMGSALWALLLVVLLAAAGAFLAGYDASAPGSITEWVQRIDMDRMTIEAIVSLAGGAALILLGGYLGGRIGDAYHRRVDAAIVDETLRSLRSETRREAAR